MTHSRNKESGIVSILVTLVIMLVISLIVISFARIARREQRQSLDRQLSTQAFYAAESGVNSVAKALKDGVPVSENTNCTDATIGGAAFNPALDAATNTSVSCLLIDMSADKLEYKDVGVESQVVPINSASGNLSEITVKWTDSSGQNNVSGCLGTQFPVAQPSSWPSGCQIGVLRVDLVNTNGSFGRNDLINNMFTSFLYPAAPSTGGVNSTTFASGSGVGNQGAIVRTTCAPSPANCTMTISSLPSSPKFYMRIRTIYGTSNVTISAKAAGPGDVELIGAQAIVDATGKAQDVLRRIQVRVPLAGSQNVPDFALQTGNSLCKRYVVIPNVSVTSTDSDPACAIN